MRAVFPAVSRLSGRQFVDTSPSGICICGIAAGVRLMSCPSFALRVRTLCLVWPEPKPCLPHIPGLTLTGNGRLTTPTNLIAILTAGGKEETMKKKDRIEDGTVQGEVPPLGL